MSVRIERHGAAEPLTPRFVRFLHEALGGTSLDDVQHANERKIDFACLRGLLAVELKTLESEADGRLSHVTDQLRQRADWPVFYGTWPAESVLEHLKDADAIKRKLIERIGSAVVRHLKKANRQLAAHSGKFPRRNRVRLVVFINEDHAVYEPRVIAHLVQHELSRLENGAPKYRHVDAVLYLTERHAARVDNNIAFPIVGISGRSIDDEKWKADVLAFVATKWGAWIGSRHIAGVADAIDSFAVIEKIPGQMRRQDTWRLNYRRNPYMRGFTVDQLWDRWDELMLRSLFGFDKLAPVRLEQAATVKDMERFTHLMEEAAHRGLPVPTFKAQRDRYVAAGQRLGLSPSALAWVAVRFDQGPPAA